MRGYVILMYYGHSLFDEYKSYMIHMQMKLKAAWHKTLITSL